MQVQWHRHHTFEWWPPYRTLRAWFQRMSAMSLTWKRNQQIQWNSLIHFKSGLRHGVQGFPPYPCFVHNKSTKCSTHLHTHQCRPQNSVTWSAVIEVHMSATCPNYSPRLSTKPPHEVVWHTGSHLIHKPITHSSLTCYTGSNVHVFYTLTQVVHKTVTNDAVSYTGSNTHNVFYTPSHLPRLLVKLSRLSHEVVLYMS